MATQQSDLQALRQRVREFAEENFRADEVDIAHGRVDMKAKLPLLADAGLLKETLPKEYGGNGAPLTHMLVILEELSRVSYAAAMLVVIGASLPTEFIGKLGGEKIRAKYLPTVGDGAFWCQAFSEPDAGSALTDMRTKVTASGDAYRLNGRKCWVSYGPIADYMIVFARFGESEGARGIGAVIVAADAPGVTIEENWATMGNPAEAIESVVAFDDVEVAPEDVLVQGDPDSTDGIKRLMSAYNTSRLGNSATCVGLMQGALDLAVDRANSRHQFGRPIAEFQGLQWKFADMAMKVEAARALMYHAAGSIQEDSGLPARYLTSVAKAFATQVVQEVTNDALQVFGGYGYRTDFPMEYRVRIARGQSIAGGTIEVQKNAIASTVLGRSFSQRRN